MIWMPLWHSAVACFTRIKKPSPAPPISTGGQNHANRSNHPEMVLHRFHPRWGAGIGAEQGENGNLVAAKPSGKILILLSKTSFFERRAGPAGVLFADVLFAE